MKSNITFVLFARNEEQRIAFPIKNFCKFGDVIILDGGSTDKTEEVSKSLGAKFYLRPNQTSINVENTENFEFIKQNITTDWIYWGYVDNIAPLTLVKKMIEIAQENKFKIVNIPLYTYLWGNTTHYAHKSYAPFLFHKDYIDFSNNYIHGIGKFLGSKEQTLYLPNTEKYALKHFSTYNLNKFILSHLRYAEAEAEEKNAQGVKFSFFKLFIAIIGYIWIYGRYSYKNGILGLIIVLNYVSYRVMTYTRLYELNHNITLRSIEENYAAKKTEILNDFEKNN